MGSFWSTDWRFSGLGIWGGATGRHERRQALSAGGPIGCFSQKRCRFPLSLRRTDGADVFGAAAGVERAQYSLGLHGELEMKLRGPGRLNVTAALSSGSIATRNSIQIYTLLSIEKLSTRTMNLDEGSERLQYSWFIPPLCSVSTFLGVFATSIALRP